MSPWDSTRIPDPSAEIAAPAQQQVGGVQLPRAYYPQHVPIPPRDRFDEPDPDDADTGPLELPTPPPDDGWGPGPDTWASRFEAPLMVSPRPVRTNRQPTIVLSLGGLVLVLLLCALIYWLLRPSDDSSADSAVNATSTTSVPAAPNLDSDALLRLVPAGYPAGKCEAVDTPTGALAQVSCADNADAGGPPTATYTLVGDKAELDATFNGIVASATRVNCPGNIQSPGPWRRNATPQKTSGVLFCGVRDDLPTVVWTDEARQLVSAVQAGPKGPDFDELYAWWSSHS